jgi:hypothetical protein
MALAVQHRQRFQLLLLLAVSTAVENHSLLVNKTTAYKEEETLEEVGTTASFV